MQVKLQCLWSLPYGEAGSRKVQPRGGSWEERGSEKGRQKVNSWVSHPYSFSWNCRVHGVWDEHLFRTSHKIVPVCGLCPHTSKCLTGESEVEWLPQRHWHFPLYFGRMCSGSVGRENWGQWLYVEWLLFSKHQCARVTSWRTSKMQFGNVPLLCFYIVFFV